MNNNNGVITADVTAVVDEEEIVEEEIIDDDDDSDDDDIIEEELVDTDDDDNLPMDPDGEQGMVRSTHANEIFKEGDDTGPGTPENKKNGGDAASVDTNSTDDWGQKWGQPWSKSQRTNQQTQQNRRSTVASGSAIKDLETFAGTSPSSSNPKVRKVLFPSSYMLFCLGVLIVLVTGGIVTGISIYARDNDPLDPLERPSTSPSPNAPNAAPSIPDFPTASPSAAPSVQFTVLLDLFASVVGDDVYQTGTSANLAANWMILQDPQIVENGGTVPQAFTSQRTEAGWIQRYLLVFLYYSTTNNRETEWLSCNPLDTTSSTSNTACQFTNPTEINGNRIIYDIVPSNRWLSAADECDWAGIECITVADEQAGVTRLAVTSINLGTFELG